MDYWELYHYLWILVEKCYLERLLRSHKVLATLPPHVLAFYPVLWNTSYLNQRNQQQSHNLKGMRIWTLSDRIPRETTFNQCIGDLQKQRLRSVHLENGAPELWKEFLQWKDARLHNGLKYVRNKHLTKGKNGRHLSSFQKLWLKKHLHRI